MPSSQKKAEASYYKYPANWIVFSWFIGFGLVVYFLYRTMITIDTTFHIFLLFGALGTLIHYLLTKNRKPGMLPGMAFYNFFGVAALSCGLFLAINFAFQGEPYTKTYPLNNVAKKENLAKPVRASEVNLGDSYIADFKYFLNFSQWKWYQFKKAKAIQITFSNGLFGYRIYKNAKLLYE